MADLIIDYDVHLHSGRVWRCSVELPNDCGAVNVTVEVIAPNQHLAQYIVMCMYPNYSSLSIEDEPINPRIDDFSLASKNT